MLVQKITKNESCSCEKCIKLCSISMGWFGSIEEVEGAAKIYKMPVAEFCKEYLIREWWAGEEGIEVPAPRKDFTRKTEEKRQTDKFLSKLNLKFLHSVWTAEIMRNCKGFVMASWGHNLMTGYTCVFLDEDNKCTIHKSKPMECKMGFGCKEVNNFHRKDVLSYWKKHQKWIKEIVSKI